MSTVLEGDGQQASVLCPGRVHGASVYTTYTHSRKALPPWDMLSDTGWITGHGPILTRILAPAQVY